MRYRYKHLKLCYALALILLTGCASELQSETVIIPSEESDQAVDEEAGLSSEDDLSNARIQGSS